MSIGILRASWDQRVNMVQYSFTSTETVRLVRTESPGRPPRLLHSSWTLWIRQKQRRRFTCRYLHPDVNSDARSVFESGPFSFPLGATESRHHAGAKAPICVQIQILCRRSVDEGRHSHSFVWQLGSHRFAGVSYLIGDHRWQGHIRG